MKKVIVLLFAMLAFAFVSCNSVETEEVVVTDSTTVGIDSTKAVVDTTVTDSIKKVETPVVKK